MLRFLSIREIPCRWDPSNASSTLEAQHFAQPSMTRHLLNLHLEVVNYLVFSIEFCMNILIKSMVLDCSYIIDIPLINAHDWIILQDAQDKNSKKPRSNSVGSSSQNSESSDNQEVDLELRLSL